MTELVVLHTRYCPGDDRSGEVWAPYAAVYASLRRHVVLVDVHSEARKVLRLLLEGSGHRVDEVDDVPGVLGLILACQPDVVLVDIDGPCLDVYELAERIRAARGRQTPLLVALMGSGRLEDRRRMRAAGFDTYLLKPAEAAEIARLVVAAPRLMTLRG